MILRRACALFTFTAIVLSSAYGVSASAATLRPDGQVVAGARVAAVADKIAHGLVAGADRTLAPAFSIVDQTVPDGSVAIAAAGSPYVTATYVGVPVAIRVDGKVARTLVAGYRVTTFVRTAVAARDLAPGTVLGPDDITVERIAAQGRPAVDASALTGRKLLAATAKGTALSVEQTVADIVVKAGQPAVLIVHDGAVALTADVVARTGGALGDTVTVVNPQTQKAVAATVTGRNRVELTLPDGDQ